MAEPRTWAEAATQMKQYEIWWAELPAPVGRRPVLLLGRDAAYRYLDRVLAAEVTTHARGIPQEVALGRGEGLPRRCVANLDGLRSVPRARLTERAGSLATRRIREVKRALGYALDWDELKAE